MPRVCTAGDLQGTNEGENKKRYLVNFFRTASCMQFQEAYGIAERFQGPLDESLALAKVAHSTEGCPKFTALCP